MIGEFGGECSVMRGERCGGGVLLLLRPPVCNGLGVCNVLTENGGTLRACVACATRDTTYVVF